MPAPTLTQDLIRELLIYDGDTGEFTWRRRDRSMFSSDRACSVWNARYAGKRAGYSWSPSPDVTYRSIRIFDWPFLAHRIAVLYVTGSWPEKLIDHRDMDGLNNRWANLRAADKSQNGANTRTPRTNTTGFKGVSRAQGRFRATIRVNGRQVWLGYHDTAEAAHAAYMVAATARSGEFARAS